MSSILPGFEYDIFISYRQKDNKYDGWVGEFVANLKKELEATFKEDVSIYFDANPHDGLLETHQVGASLEGKLKCLIFIPIISQTYCDPKCFAWEYEFRAFNQLAKSDAFGRDIRLANGNVISRILPVKIHDLDEDDKKLFEGELGGPMRSIDFIYKSAGVNRPLRTTEDHPQDNLNKTYYRDQINKVANSIKEIIGGMKKSEGKAPEETKAGQKSFSNKLPVPGNSGRKWIAAGSIAVLLLAVMAYFLVLPKFSVLKDPGTSGVAVLPFRNFTGSEELNYYGVGMASEIRTKLSMSKLFRSISSLQATLTYTDTKKTPKEIGAELNVDYLLSGLYQKAGEKIKVDVELIDASTGLAVWSLPFEGELADVFQVQARIAGAVLQRFTSDNSVLKDSGLPTNSLGAYAHYIRGTELYLGTSSLQPGQYNDLYAPAIGQFEEAIKLDSLYRDAWVGLIEIECFVLLNEYYPDLEAKIRKEVNFVNQHIPNSWQKKFIQAQFAYRVLHQYDKAAALFLQVLEDDPDNQFVPGSLSGIYRRQQQFDLALRYAEKAVALDPGHVNAWDNLANVFGSMGDDENCVKAAMKSWELLRNRATALPVVWRASEGRFPLDQLPEELKKDAGNEFARMKAAKSRDWGEFKRLSLKEKNPRGLAFAYWFLEQIDSARYYARLTLKADTTDIMAKLFLAKDIEQALKINEGAFSSYSHEGDKETLTAKIKFDIFAYTVFKKDEQATKTLVQLNNDFPDLQDYVWFERELFDRIKQRYPPFQEALNNLKRKPVAAHLTIKL